MTNSWSRRPKANPNGVTPLASLDVRLARAAVRIDLEGDDAIGVLLGDEERIAVRGEGDLSRDRRRCAAQRPSGAVERAQPAVAAEPESGNRVAAGMDDIDEPAVLGDADRLNAAGRFDIGARQAVALHLEHREAVAAGVHRQEPPLVTAERDAALVAEPAAGPGTARRDAPGRHQPPIGQLVEEQHGVAGHGIRGGVDRSDRRDTTGRVGNRALGGPGGAAAERDQQQ